MEDKIYKVVYFIVCISYATSLIGQTTQESMHDKYLFYRYRLTHEFMKKGLGECGIPSGYSIPAGGAYESGSYCSTFTLASLSMTEETKEAGNYNNRKIYSVDQVVKYFNEIEQKKKRKGKVLIYSGLGAVALGVLGFTYASGPDLKGKYLIDSSEWSIIGAFTPLDGMLGLTSMAVCASGGGLTTWGIIKYIKSK